MARKILAAKISAALGMVSLLVSVPASAITVFDPSNLARNALTAANTAKQLTQQIQAYQLQIQQYQNMLKNSVAPTISIWAQAQSAVNGLRSSIDQLEALKSQAGGLNQMLAQYKDVNYYKGTPCFSGAGCTPAQRQALVSSMQAKRATTMAVNEQVLRGIDVQQQRLSTDAAQLEQIQTNASTAGGQMEALGYANQLAGNAANQLMQIRGLLLAQQAAATAHAQAQADQQALQAAAADRFRAGTFQTPSGGAYSWTPN